MPLAGVKSDFCAMSSARKVLVPPLFLDVVLMAFTRLTAVVCFLKSNSIELLELNCIRATCTEFGPISNPSTIFATNSSDFKTRQTEIRWLQQSSQCYEAVYSLLYIKCVSIQSFKVALLLRYETERFVYPKYFSDYIVYFSGLMVFSQAHC